MRLTRRGFLGASAAAAVLPRGALAASPAELVAATARAQLLPPDYAATPVWAYGGAMPGPELRFRQGERLERRLVNGLDQSTTIHWHGLRLPNAMDGVAGVTQATVAPGGTFDYAFDLKDAGTYWYHPHDRSYEQVGRGLAGALVVEEPEPPEAEADEVLLLQDWRLQADGTMAEDFGALHDMAHAGRIGNYVSVNGGPQLDRRWPRHARLRLRLANAATARIVQVISDGLAGWVIARDGHPLDAPEALPETLVLGPGQRADLLVDITGQDRAYLGVLEREGAAVLYDIAVDPAERDAPRAAPAALAANPVPALGDLAAARLVPVPIEGGAMGAMAQATAQGKALAMQELVQMGLVWALAGAAGMPEEPLATVAPGETLRLSLRNDTAWPHVMHLHGHPFRVVSNGAPGPLLDSVLLASREAAEIAFVAEEPGDWLFHCHMLGHSASGMMSWLRVA